MPRDFPALVPTLPLQIADQIGARIVDEDFAPGERLKEAELAQSFGVSRATIREALRILERRSLVKILPQRGARVTELRRKELEDLFEMRAALLGLASRRVAERASPSDLRELRAGRGALESSVNDASQYAKASSAMVATITRLSQNEQLANYIAEFAQRFGRYARLGLVSQDRRKKSLSHWRKLVAVISKSDAAVAELLHRSLALENLAAGLAEIEKREARSK